MTVNKNRKNRKFYILKKYIKLLKELFIYIFYECLQTQTTC